ncbi:MAG: glutaredoxin 3, partial [Aestuariivirgaceae bacterium]
TCADAGPRPYLKIMPDIVIYTTPYCFFCRAAKDLLQGEGLAFKEIDVSRDETLRGSMTARSGGRRSVPQIFIGSSHVGGFQELYQLTRAGRLPLLLEST